MALVSMFWMYVSFGWNLPLCLFIYVGACASFEFRSYSCSFCFSSCSFCSSSSSFPPSFPFSPLAFLWTLPWYFDTRRVHCPRSVLLSWRASGHFPVSQEDGSVSHRHKYSLCQWPLLWYDSRKSSCRWRKRQGFYAQPFDMLLYSCFSPGTYRRCNARRLWLAGTDPGGSAIPPPMGTWSVPKWCGCAEANGDTLAVAFVHSANSLAVSWHAASAAAQWSPVVEPRHLRVERRGGHILGGVFSHTHLAYRGPRVEEQPTETKKMKMVILINILGLHNWHFYKWIRVTVSRDRISLI